MASPFIPLLVRPAGTPFVLNTSPFSRLEDGGGP
jgi:hypothetical protein